MFFFFQIDVIVNTANHKVDLNANSCSKALLKVAGKEWPSECKKIGSFKVGNIASTGPGKLNCKRVYHVRASPWDDGKGAQVTPVNYDCVHVGYPKVICTIRVDILEWVLYNKGKYSS
jgi:hypothetical protein